VKTGMVYLIGAGPGDPGLITLRGCEVLRRADLVLYDYLVNAQILEQAAPSAERICLGRHGRGKLVPQDEINRTLVREAGRGRVVARLKGGDPAVFARAAEEVDALTAAGVPFEIVPGITAALAAGSYAGIPITHRDVASSVALVTGQEKPGKEASALDYGALARFPGTLVFYMGVTTAPVWSRALLDAGKPPDTPAAIVRRCSWPDQQVIACTLGEIPDVLAAKKIRPPALVIVGEVARLRQARTWFERRPLFGQTVLVTRPEHQARELREPLAELGARVLIQPAIEISDPPDWVPVDRAIADVRSYHWLVFSSANGVRYFLNRLLASGHDLRRLGEAKIAAIGPATAETLAEYHLRADLQPAEYRAESLAAALAAEARGRRFLLLRASRGREVLADDLRAAGGEVEQIVVYQSRDAAAPDAEIAAALKAGEIAWTTVTSSAIARSLVRLFGDDLRKTRLAAISPITSGVLRQLGHEPTAEASAYTMDGVVRAMLEAEG
jgi:uroporphyrinogen III methyltransferase/synthase